MKKTILLAVVLLLGCTAFAQGNLQFNNAIHLSYSGTLSTSSSNNTISTITVPAGKVWKVESGSMFAGTKTNQYETGREVSYINLTIDRQILQASGLFNSQAIWLPSGTYKLEYGLSNSESGAGYSGLNYYAAIRILEFNIVQ